MNTKLCFVIGPIGERQSETRRRADGVLNEIIRPALETREYTVERADHDKAPGIVTEALISKILEADLVIADLTGLNPNVMYELAIRHAAGKPVIQLLEAGQELPFDIRSQNTIQFIQDLAGRSEAIAAIQAAETAVGSGTNLGNPIRRTIELRALKASNSGAETILAEAVSDIQTELARLRAEISSVRHSQKGEDEVRPRDKVADFFSASMFTDGRLRKRGIRVGAVNMDSSDVRAEGRWKNKQIKAEAHLPDWRSRGLEGVPAVVATLVEKLLEQTVNKHVSGPPNKGMQPTAQKARRG